MVDAVNLHAGGCADRAAEALAARVRNLDNAIDQWAYGLTNRAAYSDW